MEHNKAVYRYGAGFVGVTVVDWSGFGMAKALLEDVKATLDWMSQEPPLTELEELEVARDEAHEEEFLGFRGRAIFAGPQR